MAVGLARGGVASALAWMAFCWSFLWSPPAGAFEAFDGRIQVHGFVETQVRGLAEKYGLDGQELDLAQWYNILNVELEFDILPDGYGPIDLLSAFVRVEARYDCIYTHGCGMFPSVNTFGDKVNRLPKRLRDAEDPDYGGVIKLDEPIPRIQNETAARLGGLTAPEPFGGLDFAGEPALWRPNWNYPTTTQPLPVSGATVLKCDPDLGCPGEPGGPVADELNPRVVDGLVERVGFPGFDTFFDQPGGDLIPNTADDPGIALLGKYADYRFGLKDIRGAGGGAGTTQIIGPWRPEDTIQARAVMYDKANPFRGPLVPATYSAQPRNRWGVNFLFTEEGRNHHNRRYYSRSTDLADDWRILAGLAPGSPEDPLASFLIDVDCPGCDEPGGFQAAIASSLAAGFVDPFPEELVDFWENDYYEVAPQDWKPFLDDPTSSSPLQKFGGDYSGIIPCVVPERLPGFFLWDAIDGTEKQAGCIPFGNVRVTGGRGELPMRPAPDKSNLYAHFDPRIAQGLYVPSPGLLDYLEDGDFDSLDYNFSESKRAWNHGASQKDNRELKEAFLDIEFLDSRLWTRIGLQNIVWGKTELFRTTDQFNPVDIGLAGPLAGLEESRIALWAARFVYSLYTVGPLDDVRLEFATNLDQIEPIDLGACGEPYTINMVCSITTGLFAHGALGIGIAGIDRPPSFWKDSRGLEFGGRIEWRWDRFSFALADYYGYNDIPYPDAIYYFDRGVEFGLEDLETREFVAGAGRPLASGFTTGCTGEWGTDGDMIWASADRDPKSYLSMTQAGVGRDPACLKPGGAAGELNQNGFTVARQDEDGQFAGLFAAAGFEDGDVLFAEVDDFGNPVTQGNPNLGERMVPIPCDPELMPTNCEPLRYEVGLNEDTYNGELFADGWSPQNALENHTVNQQSFAWICSATLTIGAALDPGACAWTLFGTPALLNETITPVPFAEILSCFFAGESAGECGNIMFVVSNQLQRRPVFRPTAFVTLNRDYNDGVITAMHETINSANAPNNGDPGYPLQAKFLPASRDKMTLDSTMTNEQRALLGCGPYFGTRCDSASRDDSNFGSLDGVICYYFGVGCTQGGGIDFMNMEATALEQSFIGFEGTDLSDPMYTSNPEHPEYAQWAAGGANFVGTPFEGEGIWLTTSGLPQPGTIEFVGGPVCTRFVKDLNDTIVLPGCRGANKVLNREEAGADPTKTTPIRFQFDDGYDPAIDGCPVGRTINGIPVEGYYADGTNITPRLQETCFTAKNWLDPNSLGSDSKIGYLYEIRPGVALRQVSTSIPTGFGAGHDFRRVKPGARTLWHPYAGCFGSAGDPAGGPAAALAGEDCLITLTNAEIALLRTIPGAIPPDGTPPGYFYGLQQTDGEEGRDYDADFFNSDINSQSQIFRSEMAAFSWNFQQFLVQASCDADEDDIDNDPECFNPREPFAVGKCSWTTPQFCTNVKAFFGAAGVLRNTVRASGSEKYGRRTFLWHSGGELVLRYEKRNVFGFSMDFGEDATKSNWGVEFTWVAEQNFFDNDNFQDNITKSGVLNLTVSVDRPTFINFLNQNRTFFINSQWFFRYIMDYKSGFTTNGPLNVLFTVAIFTGYFQDRLEPQLVTVYDFASTSGALFPSVKYRFTDAFSAGIGLGFFFGHTQLVDMPNRSFAPAGNRAGPNAYEDGADNMLSLLRDKDEVWVKLRWTF